MFRQRCTAEHRCGGTIKQASGNGMVFSEADLLMNLFLKYVDVIIAEALCYFCHYYCKVAIKVLLYGFRSKSYIQKQMRKYSFWDRLFFLKVCRENRSRRKEKMFYCAVNIASYCIAIVMFVYFCVQTLKGVPMDKRIVLAIPFGLFLIVRTSSHYFLPELYGENRDLERDKAMDFALILMSLFYFCIYMT